MGSVGKVLALLSTPPGALSKTLEAIRKRSKNQTDICDHLETIFLECLNMQPKLIVELGVGDGESTFVLERVAKLWDADLISVDIADCKKVSSYHRRLFVHQDDITFAREYEQYCEVNNIAPPIDILFIDTSHLYDHTVQEIKSWFPFLAPHCKVIFHDTNMKAVFHRKDGSAGRGWDNERGVIRAIEDYFNRHFNEETDFTEISDGWLIRHYSHCN
jgi:cephalosporin hydroxylase